MPIIKSLDAFEILDSRGHPTLEVVCELEKNVVAHASVPSGASTGVHEAFELRDGDAKRYEGLGVLKAILNVKSEIAENVRGHEFDQRTLDDTLVKLDGTENKSRLGANAILGVSLAFARGNAQEKKIELFEYLGSLADNTHFSLPQPMLNVINGGKHADSGLDIQEFMIAPQGFDTFRRKMQAAEEIVSSLKKILEEKGYPTSVGDEGGFAPKLSSNEEGFELLMGAIERAGYRSDETKLAIDVAASSFYKDEKYHLKIDGKKKSETSEGMIRWYETLVEKYPLISIEDGFAEDDWQGFTDQMKKMGEKIQIVGDDLTTTNVKRIQTAIEKKAINSVLIKLNQIGTLSETLDAIQLTKKQGWTPFVSHRSGETTDTFIADLAVGLSCPYIKSGDLIRGERVCKYNRLMEIEDILTNHQRGGSKNF
ncbi:MAG: phosphopyruvate hydratase [Candidatus Taylorbacteria bacterium]